MAKKRKAAKRKGTKRKASKRKTKRRAARRYGPEFEPCRFEGTTLVCVATKGQVRAFAKREKRRTKLTEKARKTQNRSSLANWFASQGQGLDGRRRRRRSR